LEKRFNELRAGRGTSPAIAAPLPTMQLTSPFAANRTHPVTGAVRPHNGADYACTLGAPVFSPIAGTFHWGMPDPKGFGSSWGTVINAKTTVTIGHTRRLLVPDMATVKVGQLIAECGAEGLSNGPHLHLEIKRDGKLIDPETNY
jgi:murein DD-endopeptidase MepM/ murein hydrolase activator NlpD